MAVPNKKGKLEFQIKALDTEEMKVGGLASTFGNRDNVGDIVVKGAFLESIASKGNEYPLLWQHDVWQPIGLAKVWEDEIGLNFEAIISKTPKGLEAFELIKDGVIKKVSIGYNVVKDEYKNMDRLLIKLDLWEVSLVTFPANDLAVVGLKTIEGIRQLASIKAMPTEEELRELSDEEITALEEILASAKRARGDDPMKETEVGGEDVQAIIDEGLAIIEEVFTAVIETIEEGTEGEV